ncbi:MAG: NUDIX hydrolase [Deltaproteobacteria bacterium]|nr:NUDIX hydrolase [Deltaproteobacteria bacterium]MBW2071157.1 NUDIX hydrolase [Deltaproteobacteria bacterium]
MQREYPNSPLVGVGAVIIDNDRVVLVRRGKPPGYGQWTLPGGLVELGETTTAAVVREVSEEVSLHIEVLELLAVLDRIIIDATDMVRYHYVLLDFLCKIRGGNLRADSDILACRLVPLQELDSYALNPETREVIARGYRCLCGEKAQVYFARF